jgi:hypothetical protein
VLCFIAALLSKASAIFFPAFLAALLPLLPESVVSKKYRLLLFLPFTIIDAAIIGLHYANAVSTKTINPALLGGQGTAWTMALV